LVEKQGVGETIVLVRYQQLQAPVRLAFLSARATFKWQRTPSHNYVDDEVFAKLRAMRMQPSELCSDNVFIRRAYLDLIGEIPASEEARAFVGASRVRGFLGAQVV
jgi:hypothetical protein